MRSNKVSTPWLLPRTRRFCDLCGVGHWPALFPPASAPLLLAALLCAATAFAAEKPASISGVVVNSITGAPLPRVHIILGLDAEEDRTYGAMTTADGKFSITDMVPGSYAITMERIGFSMPTDADAPDNLVLRPDEKKGDLLLKLVPAGAITGRVTNAEGEPAEGLRVLAWGDPGVVGSDVDGTTDAKGRFRIGGLGPGRYRVEAIPANLYTPTEQRTDGTVDVEDAPTYYPRSLTFRQAARVQVAAGSETSGVEIQLARVPIVAVSGKVDGAPAGSLNAQLIINAQQGCCGHSTAGIKPDGTFRVWRLYPGKYEISAWWQAPGERDFQTAPVDFEVAGSNIDKLSLRLIPPADIAGRLEFQDDGARPAKNAPAKVTLVSAGIRGGAMSADVAADGVFHLEQLRAGKYRVIPSWSNAYVASMQLGGVAIDGSLLDLTTSAAASGALSVRLSSATGSVSGSVVDDKGPAAGARVALVFDGEGGGVPPRFATTNPSGMYLLDGIAPGKYKLVAMQEADSDYVMQSGRLDDYDDLMESIEIHPSEKLSHDLKKQAPAYK